MIIVLLFSLLHSALASSCYFPTLPINTVEFNQRRDSYPDNSIFYYKCKQDFHFDDNEDRHKVKCNNGRWEPSLLKCIDKCDGKCGSHGDCTNTIHDQATPVGEWSCSCKTNYAGPQCNQQVCETPSNFPNGKFRLSSGFKQEGKYSIGTTLEFTCNSGYQSVNGTRRYKCEKDGWNRFGAPFPMCQRAVCRPFVHSNLIFSPKQPTYPPGSTVTFHCMRSRYKLFGPSSATCYNNGIWSVAWPTCADQECPRPPYIRNAYKEIKTYNIGDKVRYTCRSGHVLVGTVDQLVCSETLQWEGIMPRCLSFADFKKYCQQQNKYMMPLLGKYVCSDRAIATTPLTRKNEGDTSTRPLTIVTATAGGLLLLLLLVISLVAFQRRRIARVGRRHGRQRMNSDDDRYSFVYYSNDVHVVLPSYDEAMQGVRGSQPPPYNTNAENSISAPPASGNSVQNTDSTEENPYATIDEILPQNSAEPPSLRRSSISSSAEEPIYASIQRVLGSTRRSNSQEESASITTLNSQEEVASTSTSPDNDNVSTNNMFTQEESIDTESVSSAELCNDDDYAPLISSSNT